MTSATSADEIALLAAMRAEPDEDAVRLAWADFLDEQAGRETPRGQLIRVQVELAGIKSRGLEWSERHERWRDTKNNKYPAMTADLVHAAESRTRESALIAEHGDAWRRSAWCEECKGKGRVNLGPAKMSMGKQVFQAVGCEINCPKCFGGDAGGLLRKLQYAQQQHVPDWKPELVRVRYSRGLKVVEVPTLADCVHRPEVKCPDCDNITEWANKDFPPHKGCMTCGNHGVVEGELEPTPWLLAVVRHHPDIESVMISGVEPYDAGDNYPFQKTRFWWPRRMDENDSRCILPDAIRPRGEYPSALAATVALGRRLAQFAYEYAAAHPQEQAA